MSMHQIYKSLSQLYIKLFNALLWHKILHPFLYLPDQLHNSPCYQWDVYSLEVEYNKDCLSIYWLLCPTKA